MESGNSIQTERCEIDQEESNRGLVVFYRVGIIVLGCLLLLGLFSVYPGNNLFLTVPMLLVTTSCAWLFSRREYPHFPILLFFGTFALGCIAAELVNNPVVNDFATQHESARAFLGGNAAEYHAEVYVQWVGQVGWSLAQVPILAIWDSPVAVKVFECICSAASCMFVYLISRELVPARIAQAVSVLLAIFPTVLFMNGQLCNQPPSALLTLVAIFIAIRTSETLNKQIPGMLICGAILALANFIRPDVVVVAVGIAIAMVFRRASAQSTIKRLLQKTAGGIALLIGYFSVGLLISSVLVLSGIVPASASSDSLMKIAYGTNNVDSGAWSVAVQKRIEAKMEEGLSYKEAEIEVIGENLSSGATNLETLIKKERMLWWGSSFTFTLIPIYERNPQLYTWLISVDKSYVALLILACLGTLAVQFRKRTASYKWAIILVPILVTLLAYVVIEVQPRYLYFAYILMFVCSSGFIYEASKRFSVGKEKRAQR